MPRKKVEVVELNKKEEKIVLEEKQSALILFWRRHSLLIFLTFLILSLTILGVSVMLLIKNMNANNIPNIKEASVNISLDSYEAMLGHDAMDDESAKQKFLNNQKFKSNGEVLLVKKIEHSKFTIKYYSDGTALMILKDGNRVTRINSLPNGNYGISNDGVISSKAETSSVTIIETKEYPWGTVNYLSDGSAEVINSKMDIFVRNAKDITNDYISQNKVTYLKETKNLDGTKLNYYYDGTIEVIKNGTSYLVRTVDDLNVNDNNVTFKNDNQATIYKTEKMADSIIIDYYTDGGAIIKDGSKTLSVRKSNSIIIKDNKIYEIVDNIYVEESKKEGNITYYTNGSAVINNYNGKTVYVPENSDIKYSGNEITTIGNDYERLSNETNIAGENVKTFEETAVIKTDEYIAIVPKDKVIYDKNGEIKDIADTDLDKKTDGFTVTNNTNDTITYCVVIERSPRTTVNEEYLRFLASAGNKKVGPDKLKIWNDEVSKALNVSKTNYILIKNSLEPYASENVNVMLWTDYDTIPNSEQDKYFYGTIKVYAWTEK